MGVPKFYRWMSERYPCLSEVVKEYQIPEFDNFYLDMNGIIHNCSHPNDDDVHFRITEEKIFADIFHYLEVLFRLVQPRKVFFMAIDGVAPRAKMNQQRGRRFRSAKEAEQREAEARRKGETLPQEARFDSNCITPGTEFMTRLHDQLRYFVTMKISNDPLWQGVKVILSGHQVPGEGEHKVVEFIRYQRSQPDYDHTTRHCLYGLDADLVMLGLCTHEPYFSLLREEVKFGGRQKSNKKPATVEETTFHLLHLSLLRDYLDHEFSALKGVLPFPYNLEAIIDDWVLMGFLVGNDFIPHLPNFHIAKGALPMLYNTYMEVLPTLGGYINEGGDLNLERFQKFMEKVAQIDYDHFNDIYADLKWFEGKIGRKQTGPKRSAKVEEKEPNRSADALKFLQEKAAEIDLLLGEDGENENGVVDDLESVTEDDSDVLDDDDEDESSETEAEPFDEHQIMHAEFKAHKRNYYMEKLEYADVTTEVLKDQAEGYVRAIQWNLHYYYNGVCSWSWYYPHHYAPYASDIKNFTASLKMNFDLAKPFLPYQQLLGVLPAASRSLLPDAYQSLMTSPNSPIIQFYPAEFETDKNGKQQEWEAVVLIPFIDEVRLTEAMDECESKMTQRERERNAHGPMQIYVYSDKDLGLYNSPGYFPSIPHNRAVCHEFPREHFVLPSDKILKGLHPKINLGICVPGFPTLRHIQHTASLKKAGVTVFNMSSQHESMIVQVAEQETPDVQKIAERLLSKTVLISWPHLVEARVVSVTSKDWKFTLGVGDSSKSKDKDRPVAKLSKEQMTPDMAEEWRLSVKGLTERYANRWGVELGTTHVLLKVCPIQGRKYIFTQNGRVTLEKQWSTEAIPFPYQMTVVDVPVADAIGKQYKTLEELFPAGSTCFMLGHPGYGSQGQVLSSDVSLKGKLRISFASSPDGNYDVMKKKWRSFSTQYLPSYAAARASGISSHLLSRITGTVYINVERKEDTETGNREKGRAGRINVGLNLKFNKRNEEVPGWSRKTGTTWMYSQKTVETLREYVEKFPDFFDYISQNIGNDVYEERDIFPGPEGHARMCQMIDWVQSLPCMKAEHQICGTIAIDRDLLPELVAYVNSQGKGAGKPIVMQVRPHLLYKPALNVGSVIPDPSVTYQLFDRVVNVREGFSVPLGLNGTVISIKTAAKRMDEVYEVLFDSEFVGGLPVKGMDDSSRIYHLPPWSLINMSHGRRVNMEREMQGRPIAVVYPTGAAEQGKPGQQQQQQQSRDRQTGQPTTRQDWQAKGTRPRPDEGRGRSATAPAPASLPKPQGVFFSPGQNPKQQPAQPQQEFSAIWNALSQRNHAQQQPPPRQQPTPKKNAVPEIGKRAEKPKKPFPSLQEAAMALPVIPKTKTEEGVKKTEPRVEAAAKSTPVAPAPAAGPPPAAKEAAAPVLGQSLSVQDLFKMAGQSLVPPPIPAPVVAESSAVSPCLQLLNLCQHKGLGIPLYSYLTLQGTIAAEIKLPSFGTVASATGATREEAAERAASLALQHPVMHQPLPAAVPCSGMPMIPPQFGPFPPHFLPAPFPVMGYPQQQPMRFPASFNNLVPMQVTRQKVHNSRPATAAPRKSAPQPVAKEAEEVKGQPSVVAPVPGTPSEAKAPSQAPAPAANFPSKETGQPKPPGKRLAIRFGTPGS